MKRTNLFAFLLVGITLLLSGCSSDDSKPIPVITITAQPTDSDELTEGSIPVDTKLTVEANVTEDATISYQWYSNTTLSNENGTIISGATGESYTIPATLEEGTHYYYCELNAEGAEPKRTNPVTVTVLSAKSITLSNLTFSGYYAYYDLLVKGFDLKAGIDVTWYAAAEGGEAVETPIGIVGYTLYHDSFKFRVIYNSQLAPGDYYFTLTLEGVTSNRVKLPIE